MVAPDPGPLGAEEAEADAERAKAEALEAEADRFTLHLLDVRTEGPVVFRECARVVVGILVEPD